MKLCPVIILAGGLATRLRPISEKVPKALIDVGGQPFIAHQLRLLHSRGIERVIISTWYRGEMISDYVGNGSHFGVDVEYVCDGDSPLGTGGAIRRALKLLDGPFFVLYGDSYLPCDYARIQAFFFSAKQLGLMTVYHNQGKWDTSNVEMADNQILAYDKVNHTPHMMFIDYGLGMFMPDAFAHLVDGQRTDLADIYQNLVAHRQLLAYEVKERFYEIGSFDGLRELDGLLADDPDQFLRKVST